jgi:hypothetical protein
MNPREGGDARWRRVGPVGPSRRPRYVPRLDPSTDDVPAADQVDLWEQFFSVGVALLRGDLDHVDRRLMGERLEAIVRELGTRLGGVPPPAPPATPARRGTRTTNEFRPRRGEWS